MLFPSIPCTKRKLKTTPKLQDPSSYSLFHTHIFTSRPKRNVLTQKMACPTHGWSWSSQKTFMFLVCISFSYPIDASISEKLDQTAVPQPKDTEIKCGSCPCVNPCDQQSPPPPPPPLISPPPPPAMPPKNPASQNYNPLPPPPPRFIYVTGVPGYGNNWEYYYGSATRDRAMNLLGFACWGLLSAMMLFG
ncbi:putative Nutrient reservoir [Quillaja saponaria]|uniref:Nutrient reservoir n=1 Tax=Quillaja saponaria TaxID=32244 RepID=A0AAD7LL06_QUISA|nr:putative Nutrient reservoir [Quillaja saponaria]